jgi:poly-gamma-glutamate synthesis protein (capsule biosynthesis protein)
MQKPGWQLRVFRAFAVFAGLSLLTTCGPGGNWPADGVEFVVTFGGDVNFAKSHTSPVPDTVFKYEAVPLVQTTAFLRNEWTGDINFINVETVVSDRDHEIQDKTFVFRSHPAQFDHLIELGVNAFSLANNHSYDHGRGGMAATLDYFTNADRNGRPILFAGLGQGAEATEPRIITVNGVRVALSAISIGSPGFAPTREQIGMSMLNMSGHWEAVLAGLAAAKADLRILSIHHGAENVITVGASERQRVQQALDAGQVNLVLGHHPHVARGVAADPLAGRAAFYSLGNLLFVGGAVRDHLPVGYDYGILGKAYFQVSRSGVRLTALEVLPLRNVHVAPLPMAADRVQATLTHLSQLSVLTDGEWGVRFAPVRSDPRRGSACFGGPYGLAARALCQ